LAEPLELNLGNYVIFSFNQPIEFLSVDIFLLAHGVVVKSQDSCHIDFIQFGLLVRLLFLFILLLQPWLLLLKEGSVARLELIIVAVLQQIHKIINHFGFFTFLVERRQPHLPALASVLRVASSDSALLGEFERE
jgi:hypothetical protein